MPLAPPPLPNIRWNVCVANAHSCNASPPTPSGFARSWCGPAPKPSMETLNALTLTFGIVALRPQGSLLDVELTEILAPLEDLAVAVAQQRLLPVALVVPHDHVHRLETGLLAAPLTDLLLEHVGGEVRLLRPFRVLTMREPHAHDGA